MSDIFDDDDDVCSVLVPVDVAATNSLTSTSAAYVELPEDSTTAWGANNTYGAGTRANRNHRVYESVRDSNVGNDPTLPASQYNAAGVATWWIDIGPTNKYAMFDGLVSTQTLAASPLIIALAPGAFNGFALFGVDADSYSITIKDAPGGNVVYSESTTPLEASQPADYYEYFFDRFKPLRQLIRADLDEYSSAEITITLNRATGLVGLGMLAIGDLRPLGIPQREAVVSPQDFSYIKYDDFGNAVVKKRANATGISIPVVIDQDTVNSVLDTMKEVLGTPVVIVGSEKPNYEWLTVFGLVSGEVSAGPYPYSTLKLTAKGLI